MDAFGRSSEAGQGAARHTSDAAGEQGAQTLEQLMATILRNALQGEGAAAGSGNVLRDDGYKRAWLGWSSPWRQVYRAGTASSSEVRRTGCSWTHQVLRHPAKCSTTRG